MKRWNTLTVLMAALLVVGMIAWAVPAEAQTLESKFDEDSTEAVVVFAPVREGRVVVQSLHATTDKEDGLISLMVREGPVVLAAGTAAPSGTGIAVPENHGLTTGDHVVIVHAGGQVHYTDLAGDAAEEITLSAGSATATAVGDRIYKVVEAGQIVVGGAGTETGTNDHLNLVGNIFATPSDSPLVAILDGTATAILTMTVQR